MDLLRSIMIAAKGLKAQSGRMRVISENIANADSTGNTPGANPYRRQVPTFESEYDRALGAQVVTLGHAQFDKSDFLSRYEPGHPAADAKGYVKYPNVNMMIETMDIREAQRSYEAGLNVIKAARGIIQSTIGILRG
ncbi:MAG: flagellar basal body rod protein FlgC [Pseudomonadota bacterium]